MKLIFDRFDSENISLCFFLKSIKKKKLYKINLTEYLK